MVFPKFLNFFVDKFLEKFWKIKKRHISETKGIWAVACGKISNSLEYPDNTEL